MSYNYLAAKICLAKKSSALQILFFFTALFYATSGLAQCDAPTGIALVKATEYNATITFNSQGSDFIVEYGPLNFIPGTGATAGTNGTIITTQNNLPELTELTSATTYDVYVRRVCNGTTFSTNTARLTFRTAACGPVNLAANSFFEFFQSGSTFGSCNVVQQPNINSNWSVTYSTVFGSDVANYNTINNQGGAGNAWFITRGIDMVAGTIYHISYYYANSGTSQEKMKVALDRAPDHSVMNTVIADHNNIITQDVTLNDIFYTATETGTFYLGFNGYSNENFNSSIMLDNIRVEVLPCDPAPTGINITNITHNSARFEVTFNTPGEFQLVLGLEGFTPFVSPSVAVPILNNANNYTFTANNLQPGVTYDVYARRKCGGTIDNPVNSEFTEKITFTTPEAPPCPPSSLPYTINFDSAQPYMPECTKEETVGEGTGWVTKYIVATDNDVLNIYHGSGTVADQAWFFTNGVNLTAGQTYYINYKSWVGVSYPEKLRIWAGTSQTVAGMTETIATYENIINTQAQTNTEYFVPETSGVYYFGFEAFSTANNGDLYIDDVVINLYTCPAPSAVSLEYLSNNWIRLYHGGASSNGNYLIIEYGPVGFNPGTGTTAGVNGTIITVTSTSSTTIIENLTPETSYDLYVRRVCMSPFVSLNSQKLNFTTPPACTAITDITVEPENFSATVYISGNPYGSIYLEYGPQGFTPGTGSTAGEGTLEYVGSSTPTLFEIENLMEGVTYDVYVRRACSPVTFSANILTTFTTLGTYCAPVSVPYTEDFETAVLPSAPVCTKIVTPTGNNSWVTAYNPGSGFTSIALRYTASIFTNANTYFITKGINLNAGTMYKITYRYGNNSSTDTEKLKVYYGNLPNAESMTTVLADHSQINQGYASYGQIYFTPPSTGVYYFGFQAYSYADENRLYLDDISVVEANITCNAPTAVAATPQSATSASVSFTSGGNNFIIEYGPTGFTPGSGNIAGSGGTIVTATSSPKLLTGLTGNTNYDVYVRQVCAGPSYSVNSVKASFTTPVTPPTGCTEDIYGQYPEFTFMPNCTGSNELIANDAWASEYTEVAIQSNKQYTFTSSVSTDFITITNASGSQIYGVGQTPFVWSSGNNTGTIRYYIHSNAFCGFQNSNRSKYIKCASGGSTACASPSALTVSNITSNSVTLSWTEPASLPSTGYQFYTSQTNTAPLDDVVLTGNIAEDSAIIINSLSSNTTYYFWIRSICGTTAGSWVSGGSFTTNASFNCNGASYGLYPENTFTPACTGNNEVIANNSWAGEFSKVNIIPNRQYTFSSSVSSDYITITNEAGTVALASGPSPLVWYSTTNSGVVRYFLNSNSSCGTQQSSRTRYLKCSSVAGTEEFEAGFTIYPNPFDNVISISNSQSILINKVEITDLNGRTVKSITL
ncbi:fibronectin type III domain-containing protein, partial [Flavobacterium sp. MK4S-17]|uniref:fibronectin type III domain-containing protein n=1 Tax=Flavobacterium sp. MK4S-17 TaxID=2543737 RepID=UPI00135C37C8